MAITIVGEVTGNRLTGLTKTDIAASLTLNKITTNTCILHVSKSSNNDVQNKETIILTFPD